MGRPEGPYRTYHENGKVEQEGTFQNHKLNGMYRLYDESGTLTHEMNFKDGREVSVIQYSHQSSEKALKEPPSQESSKQGQDQAA